MNPDQVVRLDQARELARKLCVNAPVSIEVGGIVAQKVEQVMADRP